MDDIEDLDKRMIDEYVKHLEGKVRELEDEVKYLKEYARSLKKEVKELNSSLDAALTLRI